MLKPFFRGMDFPIPLGDVIVDWDPWMETMETRDPGVGLSVDRFSKVGIPAW